MGLYTKKVTNDFDRMFDLDKDGYLSFHEQQLQNSYIYKLSREMEDDLDDEIDYQLSINY